MVMRHSMKLSAILAAALLLGGTAQAQTRAKDAEQPIEISSDALDVDQVQNIAIFTGNVVAIQGDMRLRSDKMTVYYTKKDAAAQAAAKPVANAVPGADKQSSISKIVVNGHVVLATPDESGQGNDGVYQVDQKMLHLTGNVLLTRGQNVLRGTQLDYNMATGRSVLIGAVGNLPNTTGGRVRGVFLPDDSKTKK